MILVTPTGNPAATDRRFKAIFEEQELFRNKTSNLTQYDQTANVLYNYNYAVRPPVVSLISTNSNALIMGGIYKLVNVNSHKAIEVKDYSKANGAQICQWDFHGGDNQLWKMEDAGNGFFYIKSVLSGKNLEVYGFSTDNGGRLTQWDKYIR